PGVAKRAAGQPGELRLQLADGAAGELAHGLAHAIHDLIEEIPVLLEVLLAFGSDLVDLLAAGIDRAHVALILEELEGRVDGAGRWRIAPRHLLFERLHDLVSMPRLFLEEPEDHELDFAGLEHLPAAASAARTPLPPSSAPEGKPGAEVEPLALTAHGCLQDSDIS